MIEFALEDLRHPNAQIRGSARSFFSDPTSRLSLFCEWLNISPAEIRRRVKSLDKPGSAAVNSTLNQGGVISI